MVGSNGIGYRVGYVRIPVGHPWFGVSYADLDDVHVHGGLTYSSYGIDEETRKLIKNEWWIGFDCAHCGDAPDVELLMSHSREGADAAYYIKMIRKCHDTLGPYEEESVKTTSYVQEQCISLCKQAKKAEGKK